MQETSNLKEAVVIILIGHGSFMLKLSLYLITDTSKMKNPMNNFIKYMRIIFLCLLKEICLGWLCLPEDICVKKSREHLTPFTHSCRGSGGVT